MRLLRALVLLAALEACNVGPRPRWGATVTPQAMTSWGSHHAHVRVFPLFPEDRDCPAVRVEWGDGDASSRKFDCLPDREAEALPFDHDYKVGPPPVEEGTPAFPITIRVEVEGREVVLHKQVLVVGA